MLKVCEYNGIFVPPFYRLGQENMLTLSFGYLYHHALVVDIDTSIIFTNQICIQTQHEHSLTATTNPKVNCIWLKHQKGLIKIVNKDGEQFLRPISNDKSQLFSYASGSGLLYSKNNLGHWLGYKH
jgi:hypothetical protein